MAKSKTLRRSAWALAVFVALGIISGIAFNSFATPVRRENIQTPIFTIGDETYATALNDGRSVVKFGALPFGLYSGGMAFDNDQDARNCLAEFGHPDDGWGVYRLSGDFQLDTYAAGGRTYTNKSLLVVERSIRDDEATQ
jgi:hypothetical protein